jgi:phage terminase small subunit
MDEETAFERALAEITDFKQLDYVQARISGMKPVAAARAAGYTSDGYCYTLEKRPDILAVISAHRAEIRDKVKVTHDDITDMLLDALPMVESATEQVGVAMALNKHMGYEQERTLRIKAEVEKTLHITGTVDVNTMHTLSEEQLLEYAGISALDAPWLEGEFEEKADG